MLGRVLLVGALLLAVGLALLRMKQTYDARDQARAIIAVRTHNFAPTTKARVGTWFKAARPGVELQWSARNMGLFSADVDVRLQTSAKDSYAFTVNLPTRGVVPADPAARALGETIAVWARE